MKRILTSLLSFCLIGTVISQKIELSDGFTKKLSAATIDFFVPLDGGYKDIAVFKEAKQFQTYDYAIRSKKEQLEIRYLITPIENNKRAYLPPSVNFMKTLTHLASNNEEHLIAVHSMSKEALEFFNADWGKEAVFHPKVVFSKRQHCKMLMLHKEGRGTAYLFFLFDESPEAMLALDTRYYALKFLEIKPN